MQTVITFNNMDDSQAVNYLNSKELKFKKRLSYGNVSMKEKNRIETTFEFLYRKYKHPESNNEESITPVLQSIHQHTQTVSEYTVWKQTNELREIERKQQMQNEQAKRKISAHNRAKGRMLDSFESTLTDEQLDILVNCCNDIHIFTRDIEAYEMEEILSCSHNEPSQVTVNKHFAVLFDKLREHNLICKTWMSVAEKHNCFVSRQSKPITSKDLSSALSTASLIKQEIEDQINEYVRNIVDADQLP
ncbi:hypothetical protein AGMMS50239_34190 [Bacteroidia bacterium]|nr:hypothetical protein AGMMS50239_34190 [Bacteroidia bacterium]